MYVVMGHDQQNAFSMVGFLTPLDPVTITSSWKMSKGTQEHGSIIQELEHPTVFFSRFFFPTSAGDMGPTATTLHK